MFLKLKKILFIMLCCVMFNTTVAADDVYYLTPSEEIIAWNKWHADISNYITFNSWIAENYLEKITFNVDKNRHISDITILTWSIRDYGLDEFPAHLFGDICYKNGIAPSQIYMIDYHKGINYDKEPKRTVLIKKTKEGKLVLNQYNTIKKLEGSPILEFPKGTQRSSVTFVQFGVASDKAYHYKESDFNDYEKVIY